MYIYNNRELFKTFEDVQSSVRVGDTEISIDGVGTIVIYSVSAVYSKAVKIKLYNTKYSPNFYSNLISNRLIIKAGLVINFRKNYIETTTRKPVY